MTDNNNKCENVR